MLIAFSARRPKKMKVHVEDGRISKGGNGRQDEKAPTDRTAGALDLMEIQQHLHHKLVHMQQILLNMVGQHYQIGQKGGMLHLIYLRHHHHKVHHMVIG